MPPPSPSRSTLTPRFAALHVPDYRRYFVTSLLAMTAASIEHGSLTLSAAAVVMIAAAMLIGRTRSAGPAERARGTPSA